MARTGKLRGCCECSSVFTGLGTSFGYINTVPFGYTPATFSRRAGTTILSMYWVQLSSAAFPMVSGFPELVPISLRCGFFVVSVSPPLYEAVPSGFYESLFRISFVTDVLFDVIYVNAFAVLPLL